MRCLFNELSFSPTKSGTTALFFKITNGTADIYRSHCMKVKEHAEIELEVMCTLLGIKLGQTGKMQIERTCNKWEIIQSCISNSSLTSWTCIWSMKYVSLAFWSINWSLSQLLAIQSLINTSGSIFLYCLNFIQFW